MVQVGDFADSFGPSLKLKSWSILEACERSIKQVREKEEDIHVAFLPA